MLIKKHFYLKISLYHNITLLNPAYSQEDVIEACKQAQIHDFIMSLPQGISNDL